jgi:hypothetical protein
MNDADMVLKYASGEYPTVSDLILTVLIARHGVVVQE